MKDTRKQLNVRVDEDMKDELDSRAEQYGVTLNALLVWIIATFLEATK